MSGSYRISFQVSVIIRGVISSVGMVNIWCFLHEDGQMVPLVPSVPCDIHIIVCLAGEGHNENILNFF